jgi:hypothetical protein
MSGCRRSVVVLEHSSETGPSLNSCVALVEERNGPWDAISETLVVTFHVIMLHELPYSMPKRPRSEENHSIQTLLLDCSHKPLRMGILKSSQLRMIRSMRNTLFGSRIPSIPYAAKRSS